MKNLFSALVLSVLVSGTQPRAVFAADPELKITAISDAEWDLEMKPLAKANEIYKLAVKANDLATADKLLGMTAAVISTDKLRYGLTYNRAKSNMEDMENFTTKLQSEAKTGGKTSTKNVATLNELQENTRQSIENWIADSIRYRLISAYAYKLLPPSRATQNDRPAKEHENQIELEKLWAKPECREVMQQSWKNLMKAAISLNLPEAPFPINK